MGDSAIHEEGGGQDALEAVLLEMDTNLKRWQSENDLTRSPGEALFYAALSRYLLQCKSSVGAERIQKIVATSRWYRSRITAATSGYDHTQLYDALPTTTEDSLSPSPSRSPRRCVRQNDTLDLLPLGAYPVDGDNKRRVANTQLRGMATTASLVSHNVEGSRQRTMLTRSRTKARSFDRTNNFLFLRRTSTSIQEEAEESLEELEKRWSALEKPIEDLRKRGAAYQYEPYYVGFDIRDTLSTHCRARHLSNAKWEKSKKISTLKTASMMELRERVAKEHDLYEALQAPPTRSVEEAVSRLPQKRNSLFLDDSYSGMTRITETSTPRRHSHV